LSVPAWKAIYAPLELTTSIVRAVASGDIG
jgi:hypothetical protein